jgi:hypothetical protein
VFDKALRREERAYRKSQADVIETVSTTNSKEFWDKINKLGPRTDKNIPREIVNENGDIIREDQEVLTRWKCDFEYLYNGKDCSDFDSEHYRRSKSINICSKEI